MERGRFHRIMKCSLLWLLMFSTIPAAGFNPLLIQASISEQQSPAPPKQQQEKQSTKPKETLLEEETEAIEREIQQALHYLYQAYGQAKDLLDPVVRIRSYAAIAEAIWDYNQPLARDLFRTALEETKNLPLGSQPSQGMFAWTNNTRSPEALRQEVLKKVTKLDAAFAAKLAKSFEPEREPQTAQSEESSDERLRRQVYGSERTKTLLTTAELLIETDPKRAGEVAAATLSEGVTQSFIRFLTLFWKKDRALADALFDKALQSALRRSPPLLCELIPLKGYVLPKVSMPMRVSIGIYEPPSVNPVQAAQYLNALVEAVRVRIDGLLAPAGVAVIPPFDWYTRADDLYQLYQILTAVRPYILQYLPDRIPMIDMLSGQLSLRMPGLQQQTLQPAEVKSAPSREERIAALLREADETKDAQNRNGLLCEAVHQAILAHKFENALEIVSKITDLNLRAEASDYTHYQRASKALYEDNNVETARESALQLRAPERLAAALILIAQKLAERKEKNSALAILSEAEARITRLPTSSEKARALLRIAGALLPLDTDRTFEVLSLAVIVVNQSDVVIEPLEPDFQFKFKNSSMSVWFPERNLTSVIERLFATLAKVNGTRALSIASMLEKPPLHIIAQIACARSQLEQAKEKKAKLAQKKSVG